MTNYIYIVLLDFSMVNSQLKDVAFVLLYLLSIFSVLGMTVKLMVRFLPLIVLPLIWLILLYLFPFKEKWTAFRVTSLAPLPFGIGGLFPTISMFFSNSTQSLMVGILVLVLSVLLIYISFDGTQLDTIKGVAYSTSLLATLPYYSFTIIKILEIEEVLKGITMGSLSGLSVVNVDAFLGPRVFYIIAIIAFHLPFIIHYYRKKIRTNYYLYYLIPAVIFPISYLLMT